VAGARRHASEYLNVQFETDPDLRLRLYVKMLEEEEQMRKLPAKYRPGSGRSRS
jgi:tellurite resistance protein TerC